MFGILIFQQVFINLGEKCRNRVLGNIFGICNVSVSDISIRGNKVLFRLFSETVFYQFVFLLDQKEGDYFFKVSSSKNIVHSVISLSNYDDNFIYQLFRCCDEYQVYQLMRLFL